MKVGELKAILEDYDDDHEVVLSKDSEGNLFSPLEDLSIGHYTPETTWYGEFCTESGRCNCVALWPVN